MLRHYFYNITVFLMALRVRLASKLLHNSSNRVRINVCGTFRDRGTLPLGHTRIQLNLHNPASRLEI